MEKKLLPLIILLLSSGLWSCTDKCKETRLVRRYIAITHPLAEIRSSIKSITARELVKPGKIYARGNYLFINETKEGVHVIDNTDPSNPVNISFIQIPGNGDIAIKNNILYADSYTDMVALNISDPASVKEVGRVNNVFQWGRFDQDSWSLSQSNGEDALFLQEYNVEYVTETVTTDCEDEAEPIMYDSFLSSNSGSSNNSGTTGVSGSMSRFALYDKYLYTIGINSLNLFDISIPEKPVNSSVVFLDRAVETIFPYQDKLFLGSTTGMYIYDNADPAAPKQISVFEHGRACDPVVVNNDIAYVTLRTGNSCASTQNELDLVDVSNAAAPELIKTYPMENPHGLSIDFPLLYLCEGVNGIKVFDVTDKLAVDKHLLSFNKEMHAYDVISLGKTLMLIGDDGLYQFDTSDPKNLRQLSKITVKKAVQ
jgi:hypothetical protein